MDYADENGPRTINQETKNRRKGFLREKRPSPDLHYLQDSSEGARAETEFESRKRFTRQEILTTDYTDQNGGRTVDQEAGKDLLPSGSRRRIGSIALPEVTTADYTNEAFRRGACATPGKTRHSPLVTCHLRSVFGSADLCEANPRPDRALDTQP